MNFWSDVEKEYNELSGDAQTGEEEDPKQSSQELNGLLSDLKKDLKRIPKGEVFPSLIPNDVEEAISPEEESDSDQEEGKRSLKIKAKKDKRCKVGDKVYDVGERWKDEKTGKNMMCILMNVPKDVQPLLADANILSATGVGSEWTRPSVEPQWSYTATPTAKQCQDVSSGKTSGKPDDIELNRTEENGDDKEDVSLKKSENEPDKPKKEPEIIVVDSTEPKIEQDIDKENNDQDGDSVSEDESENNKAVIDDKTNQKEKEPESTKTQENDNKDVKDEDDSDEDSGSEIENEDPKNINDDIKKEKKPEAIRNKGNENSTNDEIASTNHGHEPTKENLIQSEKITEKDRSNPTNTEDGSKSTEDQPPQTNDNPPSEKGQPIYTKETVVVQRKLIKTEQTIETTETDKTKP